MPLQRRVQHRLLPLTWRVWLKNTACTCWWLWLLETSGPITVHESFFSQTTAFVIRWNARSFSYFTVRIFESKTLCISSAIRNLLAVFMLQSKNTECDWWTLSPDWVDLPITLPEPLVLMLTQVLEGPRHACLVPRKHEGVIMCLLFAVKSPFTM